MSEIDALIQQAERNEKAGEWADAVAKWSQAIELRPSADLSARLGRAYLRTDDQTRGEEILLRVIRSDSAQPDAYYYLAFFYFEQGRLAETRDLLVRAKALDPWPQGLTLLGEVFRQVGETELARASFEEALHLNSSNAGALFGLGLLRRPTPTHSDCTSRRSNRILSSRGHIVSGGMPYGVLVGRPRLRQHFVDVLSWTHRTLGATCI